MDNDAADTESGNVEEEPTLYTTNVEIMVKDFMNQKNACSKENVVVKCNAPEEFLEIIWSVVERYIEKQLTFNNETNIYEWNHDALSKDDLHKFAVFQDKTSKRTYEPDYITRRLLQSWQTKIGVICFVHIYGIALKMKKQYEQAFKDAIQPGAVDRAGAVNNIEVFKCIDKLKEIHTDLIGTEASWLHWANWIMKQTGHEREDLMHQDPPSIKPNLLELFKVARNENEQMHEIRKGIAIGKRVNEGVASAIPAIEEEIDCIIEAFKSCLHRVERVRNHLQCLKAQLTTNDNLLDGFSESLGAQEDGFSVSLLHDIDNVDDTDHQYLESEDI